MANYNIDRNDEVTEIILLLLLLLSTKNAAR